MEKNTHAETKKKHEKIQTHGKKGIKSMEKSTHAEINKKYKQMAKKYA